MRFPFTGAGILVAVMAYGCMAGPNYRRPAVTVSKNWIEASGKSGRVSNRASDYRNWWKMFHDPVLDRLVGLAYRNNLSLQIAGVRVIEARAELGIAAGNFFPQTQQVGGSMARDRTSRSFPQALGTPLEFTQDQVEANAGWEMDFWGKFRRGIQSAGASWLESAADYDNALVSLVADVAVAYINVRTLQKRIDIARRNAETQEESLRIAQTKLRYGVVSQLDVDQAASVLNSTLATIPQLESQMRQQKDALSVLLGMAPQNMADILKGPLRIPVAPPTVVAGIPADLLRRRPDVRSAEYAAMAQCAQIGVAKSYLYPAFSISGVFGFLSSNAGNASLANVFKWENRFYEVGPSFEWSIFNYGRIKNDVRLQDARFQELLLNYQNIVLAAQRDVEDNLAAFLKAQDRADYLAKSTRAAKDALDIAVMRYREGTTDFTTVLTAEQSLLSDQDSLASTLGNISIGLVGVYRALGGGWETREGRQLVPPAVIKEMSRRTDWGGLLVPASYNPPAAETPKLKNSIRSPDW